MPREPIIKSSKADAASKRRPGRPTAEQAEQLLDNILDAAFQSFIRHGLEASSMEGIARDANVARVTLYRHFETKNALFVQVARRAQLRARKRIEAPINMAAPLEQVLREIVSNLYTGFIQPEYIAAMRMVAAESTRFPKLGRAMLNDSKYVAEPLVEYLTQLKAAGRIDIESPVIAATQLTGLACGAGRYLLVQPSRHPASRAHWVSTLAVLFARAWQTPGADSHRA